MIIMESNDINRDLALTAVPPAWNPESPAPPNKKESKKKPPSLSTTDSAALESNTSPLTSSRASNSGGISKSLAPRINNVLSKREALKRDKAWLSTSPADHLPAALAAHYASSSSMTRAGLTRDGQQQQQLLPSLNRSEENMPWLFRDEIKIIQQALLANGLSLQEHVSLGAFGCLLEQARRYALEILADAQEFAIHRNKQSKLSLEVITPADISLALDFRADADVSSTLPSLHTLAEDINRIPLPPIPSHCYTGIVLPDQAHQLTAMTFDVVSSKRVKDRMALGGKVMSASIVQGVLDKVESMASDAGGAHNNNTCSSSKRRKTDKSGSSTLYGANKGKPIPVNLKSTPISNSNTNSTTDAISSVSHLPTATTTIPMSNIDNQP